MKIYLVFLLVFLALGLFSHRIGTWGYMVIGAASLFLAGLYIVSSSAWS